MEFILTTDADCKMPENWLREFDAIIQEKELQAVAGPVMLKPEVSKKALWTGFQELDILSLQAASIGGFGVNMPFMCNAANFCYSKKAFLQVKGFEGNEEIASGDDVFLLEKFQEQGLKTAFLRSKDAIVLTSPASGCGELFFQRIRWAGKTSATKNNFGKGLGLLVLLLNFSLSAAFIAMLSGVFPAPVFMLMFLLKFNVDFLLLYRAADFFDRKDSLKNFFWSSIIYPFFSSSVGFLSLFSGYKWKGRSFKK
jgi:poly-beta-1,6-N-acetyl-D-glucosamine synthase